MTQRLRQGGWLRLVAVSLVLILAGCDDPPPPKAEIRPVQTISVHYEVLPDIAAQVGEIRPHYESDLGFRVAGRIRERTLELGQVLKAGDVIARLDDQDQRNQLRAAEADLSSAKATLVQALAEETRKIQLKADGWATAAALDSAQKARAAAEAGVDAAKAKLRLARDQLEYTVLRAPTDGTVTALGAEVGQVVSAGQMVARLARLDRKDAVFAVSQSILLTAPKDPAVTVSLLDAPEISTLGKVAEVSPSADPVTRTYTVKVALPDAPVAMRFGMSVIGRIQSGSHRVAALPSSALFRNGSGPAVWVVDDATQTVSLVEVELFRVDPGRVLITKGLDDGVRVVAVGIQTLRPGQKVKPVADEAPR